jgi:hypothetical protein
MFSIRSLILCLALFVALVSALRRPHQRSSSPSSALFVALRRPRQRSSSPSSALFVAFVSALRRPRQRSSSPSSALFVALVSAVPRPIDLYHRSLHAISAREKCELGVRSTRRRCKAPSSSTKSTTSSKATPHVDEATASPSPSLPPPPPKKATPKPSPKPAPPPSQQDSSSGGGGGGTHNGGVATFFFQNGQAGACGQGHSDSDFICAIDSALYGNTGTTSPLCGKQVHITNTQNGKSVTVTVADACTCENSNSIDLSQGTFNSIAQDASQGEVPISWSF